ncbi:MAG: GrpB family protein [Caldisericia bacterium]
MIGLKKGIVELVFHQEGWHWIAQNTISELKGMLGDMAIDVQHIGSTSIKGIHAKPIIDLQIGLKNLDEIIQPEPIEKLRLIGFEYKPESEPEFDWRRYFRKDSNGYRTHHLHAVIYQGKDWNRHNLFRDFLNSNPEWAKKYDELKFSLMRKFKHEREKYTEGKSELIFEILKIASK